MVLPTRVGMVRQTQLLWAVPAGSPHTRGDGPVYPHLFDAKNPFSPHAWGWSEITPAPGRHPPVLPTRVGMVRQTQLLRAVPAGSPHTRGDGPLSVTTQRARRWFSPHAWGWSALPSSSVGRYRVLPTRVGMVRSACDASGLIMRSPHTRGDGPGAILID